MSGVKKLERTCKSDLYPAQQWNIDRDVVEALEGVQEYESGSVFALILERRRKERLIAWEVIVGRWFEVVSSKRFTSIRVGICHICG